MIILPTEYFRVAKLPINSSYLTMYLYDTSPSEASIKMTQSPLSEPRPAGAAIWSLP